MSAEEILGMKPEDLRSRLDGSATKDDITGVTSKVESIENSLAAIQASLAKLTTPPPTPEVIDDTDPTTKLLTDPAAYVRDETKGISKQAAEARADILEMRARAKYPGAFAKYNDELTASANRFSTDQRAQEGFWDFHIRTFMGDKYIAGKTEGSYPSLMGSGSYAPGSGSVDDDPNKGIDPQVATFLKERGIPLEKAAQIKKMMIDSGEPVDLNTYKQFKKAANG
jgi:hypothetical protein